MQRLTNVLIHLKVTELFCVCLCVVNVFVVVVVVVVVLLSFFVFVYLLIAVLNPRTKTKVMSGRTQLTLPHCSGQAYQTVNRY